MPPLWSRTIDLKKYCDYWPNTSIWIPKTNSTQYYCNFATTFTTRNLSRSDKYHQLFLRLAGCVRHHRWVRFHSRVWPFGPVDKILIINIVKTTLKYLIYHLANQFFWKILIKLMTLWLEIRLQNFILKLWEIKCS